ncbi:MAG: hypothetical protein H6Q64_1548, partial [Firmicutes bacterium]|nr:hypothetical protein [Bacillota bacterium]
IKIKNANLLLQYIKINKKEEAIRLPPINKTLNDYT